VQRTTPPREEVEQNCSRAQFWSSLFIRQRPEVFWIRDVGQIASQLLAAEAVYPHMGHAFAQIVNGACRSGGDGNHNKPKVEPLLPEVEFGVAAPVPHHLKEDPGGCEKDHSNQQPVRSRRVNLAVRERLRDGVVRGSSEAPIRHPVAHAGCRRDPFVAAHRLALAASALTASCLVGRAAFIQGAAQNKLARRLWVAAQATARLVPRRPAVSPAFPVRTCAVRIIIALAEIIPRFAPDTRLCRSKSGQ
jgi:hypothetical protein